MHATSLIMLALPTFVPRFKSTVFHQNRPKIKLFLHKNAKFLSAGGKRLGALPPDPRNSPPIAKSWLRACLCPFVALRYFHSDDV